MKKYHVVINGRVMRPIAGSPEVGIRRAIQEYFEGIRRVDVAVLEIRCDLTRTEEVEGETRTRRRRTSFFGNWTDVQIGIDRPSHKKKKIDVKKRLGE